MYVSELYRGTPSCNNHHDLLCEMELLTHKCIFFFIWIFGQGWTVLCSAIKRGYSLRSLGVMYKLNGFTHETWWEESHCDGLRLPCVFARERERGGWLACRPAAVWFYFLWVVVCVQNGEKSPHCRFAPRYFGNQPNYVPCHLSKQCCITIPADLAFTCFSSLWKRPYLYICLGLQQTIFIIIFFFFFFRGGLKNVRKLPTPRSQNCVKP